MSAQLSAIFRVLTGAAIFMYAATSCSSDPKPASNAHEFSEYVSAYSSGLLSSESQIRIVLAKPIEDFPGVNMPVADKVLSFTPEISGELTWEDQSTILFSPAAKLPDGESFQATLALEKLYNNVPEDLKLFTFNFQIISQSFEVSNINLRTYINTNLQFNKIEGDVLSADVADQSDLNELIAAKQTNKNLNVSWRSNADKRTHHFVIDSVVRGDEAGKVELDWGEKMGESLQPEVFEIPALGDFTIVGINVIQTPEQKVIINFSDPLQEEQAINGLVEIENANEPSYVIDNTELQLFIKGTISGVRKVRVYPGIKNAAGYVFNENYESEVKFADLKPAVELIGDGSILPSSNNLALPFKAVNLRSIDVFILKIFASNVPQFLQTNKLEGNYQLKRVGRPIAYKRIDLTGSTNDLKRWNNFSLDVADLVKPEPGAIYRIELKFKKSYSLYECHDDDNSEELVSTEEDELNTEAYDNPSNYYWDDYYYEDYYWEDYDYRERDNPCNIAYYSSGKSVAKNIIATNIALTVKGGDKGVFTAFVTDINSTKPVSGAKIQFLNYQQQEIKSGVTGSNGSVTVKLDSKPFLAIAQSQNQSAYLRIDDGSSLSLSNFDVSGSKVEKGLKGFIYAERGVWRPGDTIYTNFMLEDKEHSLPDGHPVIFEVRNPEGKLIERQVKSTHVSGIYNFPFATTPDAVTGFYSCLVKVGGANFSKALRVETIKPNRLKVQLTFDDEVLTGTNVNAHLHSNWLTGAKAKNLKADVTMQMRNQNQPFEKFAKYDFTDETRQFYSSELKVFEGNLDANGDVITKLAMGSYTRAPGMLQAVFVTRVFEPGGDFSIDRQAFNYAPFSHLVGMQVNRPQNAPWLTTDKPINVDVITTDSQGKLADRTVQVQVYAIDWSWWWSSGRSGLANYLNSSYARSIMQTTVNTKSGKGNFNFQVDYPNYGNYLVRICDEESGHCTSQTIYIDWPMSRDRSGRGNPGAPTMLTFSADKESYNVGETAHISIPTSSSGRLLVSLETGSELLEHMWVDAKQGQTELDIPITEQMAPNVYAFVSYIQPHSKTVNDLPIRLYGVVPLTVDDKSTRIEPVISAPVEWRPEKVAEFKISEKLGKAMTYTLAVVDEGLLDITRFKTPNPWQHFYAKEALGIRTWDYFDDIIGAFGGVIEKSFAIGGDQELDPSGKKRLNRFKPLVKILGPYKLKAGETASHKFNMPNYVGSARIMVVAREKEAYGHAEKAVPVRKPLMVLATLPRVLGPGEKVKLPVQVFAMKENVKNVQVTIKAGGLFDVDNTSQNITFSEVGDQMVYFDLTVKNKVGKGTVDISVKSGSESASYNVAVDVRSPNGVETKKQTLVLKPGESNQFNLEAFGMEGSNKATLEISALPELNITDALGYLMRYPHGCIEQTVSTAFPQLFIGDIVNLTDAQKTMVKENVMYALKKLQANQMAQGSFSTWPSSAYVNSWSTIYAGHFLLEAERKGYKVPSGTKNRWLKYEKSAASVWRNDQTRSWYMFEQSYRLFVLALAGEADLGAMNRLRNYTLTKSAAWRLAAAYIVAGQPEIGKELMNGKYIEHSRYYYDPTFHNEMRASAMRLENYMLLNDNEKAFEQAIILAGQMNDRSLYTTQSTSFALMYISKYLKDKKGSPMMVDWSAGKQKESVNQARQFYSKQMGFEEQISVRNKGTENVYVTVLQEGTPLPGKESLIKSEIASSIVFKSLDGAELSPDAIPQGTDFKAVVTISSNADVYKLHDMALTQIFPSGWEIVNTRLLEIDDLSGQSPAEYKDYRDDRVYTYFAMYDRKSKIYEVRLNASYVGEYYLPGVKIEAMYYPEVVTSETGKWVKVVAN